MREWHFKRNGNRISIPPNYSCEPNWPYNIEWELGKDENTVKEGGRKTASRISFIEERQGTRDYDGLNQKP
uniref:Uncharacterized protein n=1 Tax=Nelumbo nucifera TaxID=4432 RepID=A0A822ZP45_NELNU|nr:TPA_asm: hypothetical protein HUJ06_016614 [Nelumbo nucifera]